MCLETCDIRLQEVYGDIWCIQEICLCPGYVSFLVWNVLLQNDDVDCKVLAASLCVLVSDVSIIVS